MADLPAAFHLYGIRHHGPGCARMLLAELEQLRPDCLLIEGPPEADALLAYGSDPEMKPPVALLVYSEKNPQKAAFFPLAEFSPEWQAIQYGLRHQVPVRFMDLAQRHQLVEEATEDEKAGIDGEEGGDALAEENVASEAEIAEPVLEGEEPQNTPDRHDPLTWLAKAAGLEDGEEWWERMVEERRVAGDIFLAIREAMTTLREGLPDHHSPAEALREQLREATMRETMRAALKEGFQRIAVVCGAWHVPALAAWPAAAGDKALLAKLPKTAVAATWVPWTYGRLATSSGYGAGVSSPGYYHFLWENAQRGTATPAIGWLIKVAGLLRTEDIDCSSAHVIESVRLADSLAAMRDRSTPGLRELNEAVSTVICMGDPAPLQLISKKLIVSERLGEIPEGLPMVPVAKNLADEQKRLRFKPEAVEKQLDLDLRKPGDLERSWLLHRLNLLGIDWGGGHTGSQGRGTFHELWTVQWEPEYAIRLVENAIWGNTVEDAAVGRTLDTVMKSESLAEVAKMAGTVLTANLPKAIPSVVARLDVLSATTGAVGLLMEAVPPLVNIARYGNVRQTDASQLLPVLDGMVDRICIGLNSACSSLDDAAAEAMHKQLIGMHQAVKLLENAEHLATWQKALRQLADRNGLHGLLAGSVCRRLLDDGVEDSAAVLQRISFALSQGNDPNQAAAWVQGFLHGSGLVLLHDDRLFQAIDAWLCQLTEDAFRNVLPLVRRTFSDFATGERRQIGERVKQPLSHGGPAQVGGALHATSPDLLEASLDAERVAAILPVLRRMIGLPQAHP